MDRKEAWRLCKRGWRRRRRNHDSNQEQEQVQDSGRDQDDGDGGGKMQESFSEGIWGKKHEKPEEKWMPLYPEERLCRDHL